MCCRSYSNRPEEIAVGLLRFPAAIHWLPTCMIVNRHSFDFALEANWG